MPSLKGVAISNHFPIRGLVPDSGSIVGLKKRSKAVNYERPGKFTVIDFFSSFTLGF